MRTLSGAAVFCSNRGLQQHSATVNEIHSTTTTPANSLLADGETGESCRRAVGR